MQKVLLILGMHRSGTSLVTQWLSRCGLDVGSHLLPAGIGNADGHFEDEEFLSLHGEWLTKRQLSDNGLVDQSPSPLSDEELQQLKTLLARKASGKEQWGWKEPRTCLWLPVYRQCLPDAYSLVVVRNFNDTVNSLVMREYRLQEAERQRKVQRKTGLSKLKWKYLKRKRPEYFFKHHAEGFLKVWLHYYDEIIAHCNALPAEKLLLVNYEDLLTNDTEVTEQLVDQWGFSLTPVPFSSVFKKELLSNTRKIAHYIGNKELLEKAIQLELQWRSLVRAGHVHPGQTN